MVSIDPFAFHFDAHVPDHTIVRIMDHADVAAHSGMLSTVDIQRLAMLKDAGKRRDLERSLIAVKQELADLTGKSVSQVDVTHDSKGAPALSSSPGMHISIWDRRLVGRGSVAAKCLGDRYRAYASCRLDVYAEHGVHVGGNGISVQAGS